jgi:hypothetical protein
MFAEIEVKEHSKIDKYDDFENRAEIFEKFNRAVKSLKYLGIKTVISLDNTLELKADYFIGYRWFEKNKSYIHISQKLYFDKKADYLKMFMECLRDPVVSKTITDNPDKLYKVYFNEPLIEIQDKEDEITPFFVVHFLHLVKKIVQKGLKKGYVKTTQNLTSKVKGKILINQTIKYNHLKNRLDKTMCNYQIFTINCIENQILKTALMKCSKYLFGIQDDTLSKILRQNISAFELVEQKDVYSSDFLSIKHSPFYTEYKEALNLAQMIFKRFGFALNESPSNTQLNKIPPYYINMPELFERYAEVKLRQMGYDIIDGNKTNTAHWQMKPDFLLPSKKIIIDAKYKYWYESGKNEQDSENSEYKEDYMQLSLYGRDMKVRKSLGLQQDDDTEVDLIFIYPSFNASENLNLEQSQKSQKFNKISKIGLKIPFLYNIMQDRGV